jgi:predicted HTH transcriptional regulator
VLMQLNREYGPQTEDRLDRWIREGEHKTQDFKFAINNSKKISLSLSAFANTEGGRLLIGVKDNGKIVGVHPEDEIHMLEGAAELYCTPAVDLNITIMGLEEGAELVCAEVAACKSGFIRAHGPDNDQKAYVRVADENMIASPLHLELWKRRGSENAFDPSTFSAPDKELLALLSSEDEWRLNALIKRSQWPRRKALQRLGDFLHWGVAELKRTENEFRICPA